MSTRDDIITDLAVLIAGLQGPLRHGMLVADGGPGGTLNIGSAHTAYSRLHRLLVGYGWTDAATISRALTINLSGPSTPPDTPCPDPRRRVLEQLDLVVEEVAELRHAVERLERLVPPIEVSFDLREVRDPSEPDPKPVYVEREGVSIEGMNDFA